MNSYGPASSCDYQPPTSSLEVYSAISDPQGLPSPAPVEVKLAGSKQPERSCAAGTHQPKMLNE